MTLDLDEVMCHGPRALTLLGSSSCTTNSTLPSAASSFFTTLARTQPVTCCCCAVDPLAGSAGTHTLAPGSKPPPCVHAAAPAAGGMSPG